MKITHVKLSNSRLVKGYGIVKYFALGEKGVHSLELAPTLGVVFIRKSEDDPAPMSVPIIGCDWIEWETDVVPTAPPKAKGKQQAA